VTVHMENDHHTFFSRTKANGRFVPFNLEYFLDLTVFNLLSHSHKGKKCCISPMFTLNIKHVQHYWDSATVFSLCVNIKQMYEIRP